MIGRRMTAAARAAAVGAALAMALTGCIALPTSGDVAPFDVGTDAQTDDVGFLPDGPIAGATQEDQLRGFIRAGNGPSDYGVARQFLSPDFAAAWLPNDMVYITDGGQGTTQRIDDDSLVLTLTLTAQVDASGAYTALPTPVQLPISVDFVKQKGEWRISAAPNAIVLSRNNFGTIFDGFPLYFLDPGSRFLVPDLRWFPSRGSGERIVRALLDGPSPWLAPGVVSAFPEGTQLGTDGVDITAGVATVDLPSQVLAETPATKALMFEQLDSTLTALDTVTSLRLAVGGIPVQVPDADGPQPVSSLPVSATPLGGQENAFGYLTRSSVTTIPGISEQVVALAATEATLSRDDTVLAALTDDGTYLVTAANDPLLIDDRDGLVAPSIDPEDFVWSAATTDTSSEVIVVGPDGKKHDLALSAGILTGRLVSLDLSRDGTRALFAVMTATGPMLTMAAVSRDAAGTPVALGPPIVLPLGASGTIVDTAWVDELKVVAILAQESGTVARTVEVGGRSVSIGPAAAAVKVVGGNGGVAGLRVLDSAGDVLQSDGTGSWQRTGVTATFLADQQ